MTNANIRVIPSHTQGSPIGQPLTEGCLVDDDLGIIHVTDDLDASEVYTWIRDKIGDRAALATKVWRPAALKGRHQRDDDM